MNKKVWYRLIVLQHLDEFKEIVNQTKEDSEIGHIIQKIKEAEESEELIITLPAETLEYIIQRNIHLDVDNEEETLQIKAFHFDWEKIQLHLFENYNHFPGQVDLEEEKRRAVISNYKAELVTELLKKAVFVIEEYFPLQEYGMPSQNFLEALMIMLVGDEIHVDPKPMLFKTFDPYGTLLRKENEYLRQKLKQAGIDVDKEMIKDGFTFKQQLFEDNLKKNPSHFIRVEPKTKAQKIKAEAGDIAYLMGGIEAEAYPEIHDYKLQLKTMISHAERYVDRRFNKKMNPRQIADELFALDPTFNKDEAQVFKDIEEMAKSSGFSELEKSIPRYHTYGKS